MTVDVHQGPDGVEIVEQHTRVVNCAAEQPLPPPPQPLPPAEEQPPVPQLFDMDLERMHVELHKNRYLTPQDFLGDVGKMVHNAVVCQSGDLERLHRAQAMYTATEVSLQDFDPHFRAECERMAMRERQRRAERKKEKEKAKAKAQSNQEADASGETYAPGTRRSARHNGQQPEIAITDVTKLERAARLKRQRSTGPSNGSQESGDEAGDGRDAKRSRVNSEDNVPVNSVEPCDSQQVSTVFLSFAQPGPNSVNPNDDGGLLPDVPPPAMGGGFDPSLLNPAPSPTDQSPYRRMFSPSSAPVEVPPEPSAGDLHPPPHSPNPALAPTLHPEQSPISQPPPDDHQPDSTPDAPPISVSPIANKSPAPASPPPESHSAPIEVDREPTPLPDFYFNQAALARLADDLRDMTSLLSIEQLEQLRASCLRCIWAHRSDWDRDNLILELGKVLHDFVDEVRADYEDEMLVSPMLAL
jgi:hypothetical protein